MTPGAWREFIQRYEAETASEQPKYKVLRNAIVAAIESGCWQRGERMPTELELTRATPYSLGTVQRAMRALADEGIIVRRQGHGTFLSGSPEEVEDPWHYRFLDDSGFGFLPVEVLSTHVLRMQQPGRWSRILSRSAQGILRVQRLVNVGNEFRVLSRLYLKADDVEDVMATLDEEFDWKAIRRTLAGRAKLPITHVSESLTVHPLPEDVVRLLGLVQRAIGMYIESIARAGRSHYLYYQQLFVPPTRRRLHVATRTYREPERRSEMAPASAPEEPWQ